VDLPTQQIHTSTGMSIPFGVDASRKHRLLNGLDDIGMTLQRSEKIRAYEARQTLATPWLFPSHLTGDIHV
jgi:3-isopropylmalate/(R)-2-methylmalate dehydratase small subunit